MDSNVKDVTEHGLKWLLTGLKLKVSPPKLPILIKPLKELANKPEDPSKFLHTPCYLLEMLTVYKMQLPSNQYQFVLMPAHGLHTDLESSLDAKALKLL